ncbi:MAG: membrane protein insertion efficiency factor YidD [Candidatus Omnitrophota bacterium]
MPSRLAAGMLKAYHRWASPWLPRSCRFYPTCSVYAAEVITTFGLFKGGFLSLIRISKCHPFHPGGVDMPPLPAQGEKNNR